MNKHGITNKEYELLLKAAGFMPKLEEKESAWRGHTPFSGWLLHILKPKIFVELGTHWGISYFSFCQVVREEGLETRCYAVDTWRGEDQAGRYDEDVYKFVSQYNHDNYSAFSSLLRMPFDEALESFSDQKVDLLHIDGYHSYDAVKHDFESWRPKLAPGAVVLFHDTNVRDAGFGVWKFWEELQENYSCTFEFYHAYGLGILQFEDSSNRTKSGWINLWNGHEKLLQDYFSTLGARQLERHRFTQLVTEVQQLREDILNWQGRINDLQVSLAECDDQLAAAAEREEELHLLLQEKDQALNEKDQALNEIWHSSSWKLTIPFRAATTWARQAVSCPVVVKNLWSILRQLGVYGFSRKIVNILVHDGFAGLLKRVRYYSSNAGRSFAKTIKHGDDCLKRKFLPVSMISVDEYDVFFIDIFDTAILRLFLRPVDVFEYISYLSDDNAFLEKRINKELSTRKSNINKRDISIHDIYADFYQYNVDDEYNSEKKVCVRNDEIYRLYEKIINSGKKVYFVSDMYLDKSFLEKILERSGYGKFSGIFVSSEDDLIKGDGSRFEWLKNNILTKASRPLHIGDHVVADFEKPKEKGLNSFHYYDNDFYFRHDSLLCNQYDFLVSKKRLGLSFVLGVFRYWKCDQRGCALPFWRQFGFFYGGPLIARFCSFIHKKRLQKKQLGNKIFFLARDGDILNQVYSLLYGGEGVYMYASRRCMSLPALTEYDFRHRSDLLDLYTIANGVRNTEDILERFAYSDLEGLEKDLNGIDWAKQKWSSADIKECICRHEKEILAKAFQEREVLLDYLESVGFFDSNNPLVVDVGWRGTIQDALIKLSRISGRTGCRIDGVYLGVNRSVKQKEQKKGFLFNDSSSEFHEFLNLIELLTSSPDDGVVRIEKLKDGKFDFIHSKTNTFENERQLVSREIQQGVIDFANILKDNGIDDIDFIEAGDFKYIFQALQMFPSEETYCKIGSLKHAMVIGSAFENEIIKFRS